MTVRTGALDDEADQHAPAGRHRPALVIPIRLVFRPASPTTQAGGSSQLKALLKLG
jgi:hypothetical protein